MMRAPAAGRNFEMAGGDPFLAGVTVRRPWRFTFFGCSPLGSQAAETVIGIQSQGVTANSKHMVVNDQETFRGAGRQRPYS